jgi:MarR family transcriptional regulator, organic hydroperoxide resistance regulator
VSSNKRDLAVKQLLQAGRETSRVSLLFRSVVATAAGINVTDAECLDYLLEKKTVTAGELALIMGLTTGSVTAMIDRLEKSGFVIRRQDESDRRKVLVSPIVEKIAQTTGPYYDALVENTRELLKVYSEHELELLTHYNQDLAGLFQEQVKRLKERETKKRIEGRSA